MAGRRGFQNRHAYLRWCYECNVPLLRKKCDICGGKGKAVAISQSGDARPALSEDRSLVVKTICAEYGPTVKKALRGKTIMLNKMPGIDKADEIIIDGIKVGAIAFDIFTRIFRFTPSIEGCVAFEGLSGRKIKVRRGLKGHLKGKYLDSCDIETAFGRKFSVGNYAILIFADGKIGKGLVKKDISSGDKVIKMLDLSSEKVQFSKDKNPLDMIIKANQGALNIAEDEAVSFVKKCVEDSGKPITLSFSGGKDSLCVLEIAKRAGCSFETIFIDTGVEFPETVDYVRRIGKIMKMKIRVVKSGRNMLEDVERDGPPTKDDRWCSKRYKLGPIADYIGRTYPDGCLTFEGKRKYESFTRSLSKRVEKNPYVLGQVSAYPILNWNALNVWLFILRRKLKYNPLYDMGFERVGCWMCPSGFECEFVKVRKMHRDLYERFYSILKSGALEKDLDMRYVTFGFWRWKTLPPKMIEVAKEKDVKVR